MSASRDGDRLHQVVGPQDRNPPSVNRSVPTRVEGSSNQDQGWNGGLQILHIGLVDAGRGQRDLVVRWRAYDPTIDPAEADFSGAAVLLGRLAALDFNYFGRLARTEPAAWQDGWVHADTLPLVVTMRVVLADGRAMPDCVIALRALPLVDLRPCRRSVGPRRLRNRPSSRHAKAREAAS